MVNRAKLDDRVSSLHLGCMSLMTAKGFDYADADALSNFKRVHKLCKILDVDTRRSTADCALFLVLVKIDRWTNLRCRGEKPKNESIEDTVKDLHNYIDFALLCEIDA